MESEAAATSEEDELLYVEARLAGEDSDASKSGAFTSGETDEACWACASKAVPAITKLSAAARQAIPKRRWWMFIW